MARTPSTASAWLVTVCLLLVFAFAAGFLLPFHNNVGVHPTEVPDSTAAAAAPGVPDTNAITESPQPAAKNPVASARGRRGPVIAPDPRTGEVCSFDAIIYEVRLNPSQISLIDVEALTQAAAARESFEKALAALGSTRPLYRANQTISLGEEQIIQILNLKPDAGPAAPMGARGLGSRTAKDPGAIFDLFAKRDDVDTLDLMMVIQTSIALDSAASGPGTTPTPLLRSAEINQHRPVAPGTPFLFVDADAATLDANGKAVVLITRIILGMPQAPATKPAPATARSTTTSRP
jgi:hypothetical protein